MDDWVRKGRVIELAVGFFHLLLFFIKKTNGELDRLEDVMSLMKNHSPADKVSTQDVVRLIANYTVPKEEILALMKNHTHADQVSAQDVLGMIANNSVRKEDNEALIANHAHADKVSAQDVLRLIANKTVPKEDKVCAQGDAKCAVRFWIR